MSKWSTVSCRHCRDDIQVHEDWDRVPEYHKECAWYASTCDICGSSMKIHRGWDNPPTAHKECKAKQAAKWHTRSCNHCRREIKYHEDWDNVPEYHKECAWTTKPCDSCHSDIRIHRGWQTPPRFCDSCKLRYAPKNASCVHCGNSFDISTGTQVKCKEQGWDIPKRCEACRELFKHKPFRTSSLCALSEKACA